MSELARVIIAIGIFFLVLGIIVAFMSHSNSFPKLPGDVYIKKDNFVFYFPWVTSLIASIIISAVLYFFTRK